MYGLGPNPVSVQPVNIRSTTLNALPTDLKNTLARIGIEFLTETAVTGDQERQSLKEALHLLKHHLTTLTNGPSPLVMSHQEDRIRLAISVREILPPISEIAQKDHNVLTSLEALPAQPSDNIDIAVNVSTNVADRLEGNLSNWKSDLETLGIHTITTEANTPFALEQIAAALCQVKETIDTSDNQTRFNCWVRVINTERASDQETLINELRTIGESAELNLVLRPSVSNALPGINPELGLRFPDIAHHHEVFLQHRFQVAMQKFMMVKWQVDSLPPGYDHLKRELGTYALGFLAHGALVTMTSGREEMNYPLLEFRGKSVNIDSLYHRAAAGVAIAKLFKELLNARGNACSALIPPQLSGPVAGGQVAYASQNQSRPYGNRRDTCVLVDGPQFMSVLEHHYTPIRPQSDTEADMIAAIQTHGIKNNHMVDVSRYFSPGGGAALNDEQIMERINNVRNIIAHTPGVINRAIFAAVPIPIPNGNAVTVAVAFDTRNGNTVKQHHREFELIATYGSRADIVKLREATIALTTMAELEQRLPVVNPSPIGIPPFVNATGLAAADQFNRQMIHTAIGALRDVLDGPAINGHEPLSREQIYYGLTSQLLHFVDDHLDTMQDDQIINRYLYDTVGRMADLTLDAMTNGRDHVPFINRIDLLVEDAIHLMTLLQIPAENLNIPALINPRNTPEPLLDAKRSYVFNSGMKCTQCILNAIKQMHRSKYRPIAVAEKPTVAHTRDIYFEERSLVCNYANRTLGNRHIIQDSLIPGDPPPAIGSDLVIFDYLPNAAAELDGVTDHDGVVMVTRAISGRSPASPVTVVIDTTTDMFDGPRTQAILNNPDIAAAILNGTLNLVVFDSLAKFAQAGRDKYTGGIIQVYNSGAHFFADFNRAMADMQADPSLQLSTQASRFFSAMLNPMYALPSFQAQLDAVRQNTNRLSTYLRDETDASLLEHPLIGSGNCIELVSRHGGGNGDIPMLALKFPPLINSAWSNQDETNNSIFSVIRHYLLAVSQAQNLPISSRGSFGFDHATLTEARANQTLRLTVGLEDDSAIRQYAKILRNANVEIRTFFEQQGAVSGFETVMTQINRNLSQANTRTNILQAVAAFSTENGGVDIPFFRFVELCAQVSP